MRNLDLGVNLIEIERFFNPFCPFQNLADRKIKVYKNYEIYFLLFRHFYTFIFLYYTVLYIYCVGAMINKFKKGIE